MHLPAKKKGQSAANEVDSRSTVQMYVPVVEALMMDRIDKRIDGSCAMHSSKTHSIAVSSLDLQLSDLRMIDARDFRILNFYISWLLSLSLHISLNIYTYILFFVLRDRVNVV